MTINEFANSFDLHDSLLENITYDKNSKKVTLFIDFCYWLQKSYKEDMNETGMIVVEFEEVIKLNYTPYTINSDAIVSVSYGENEIMITVFNDLTNRNMDIFIKAKKVKVSDCE